VLTKVLNLFIRAINYNTTAEIFEAAYPSEPFALQIFSASLAKKAAMYFAWSCLNKHACSDVYQFIRNMR